jgi:hypothetical protein
MNCFTMRMAPYREETILDYCSRLYFSYKMTIVVKIKIFRKSIQILEKNKYLPKYNCPSGSMFIELSEIYSTSLISFNITKFS